MLDMARKYVAKGKSIIPLRPRSKIPAIASWAPYQERLATDEELVSWFSGKEANIAVVTGAVSGLVVVDEDSEEGAENAKKLGLVSPVRVQARKGFHHYFKHPGTKVSNGVRIAPGLDLRGDGGYVVAPPSIHETGHVYRWVGGGDLPTYLGYTATDPVLVNRAGWVADAVNSLEAGNRHATLVRLVGKLIHEGLNESETLALLLPHLEKMREEGCQEDPVEHARKIIAWASAREHNNRPAPAVKTSWNLMTTSDLIETAPPVGWLIPGWIPRKSITWLFGNQGWGKSWVTMDLALRLSENNVIWLNGSVLPKARVLYLDDESSHALLADRIRRLAKGRNIDTTNVRWVVKEGWDIMNTADYELMEKAMAEHRPEVVIMDSYSCFHTGDDNSTAFTMKALATLKSIVHKYNISLIVVDHMSSGAASRLNFDKNNDGTVVSNDVAGSKVKIRQADSSIALVKKDGRLELKHVKARFGQEQAPLAYSLVVADEGVRLVPEPLISDATEF